MVRREVRVGWSSVRKEEAAWKYLDVKVFEKYMVLGIIR